MRLGLRADFAERSRGTVDPGQQFESLDRLLAIPWSLPEDAVGANI